VSAEQGATMHNENLPLEGSACRFRPLAREQTRTCCWKLDKAAEATGGVTWSGLDGSCRGALGGGEEEDKPGGIFSKPRRRRSTAP
jgi:hypothetical protein